MERDLGERGKEIDWESRLKRLEAQLEQAGARKAEIDARLADQSLYQGDDKQALKALLLDQAYIARELETLEAEWLEKQTLLEKIGG